MKHITEQINLYSFRKASKSINVTVNEIEKCFSISIRMPITEVLQISMYRAQSTQVSSISNIISVN